MAITSLESYLNENRLVQSSNLEALLNCVLGIDVQHYINKCLSYKREPAFLGVGCLFLSLQETILSDIECLEGFGITPIFVFSGLRIDCQFEKHTGKDISSFEHHVETTWNKLSSPSNDFSRSPIGNTTHSFHRASDNVVYSYITKDLIKLFIAKGIDYVVSPYDSSFQLAYFHQIGLVDAVFGSTDLLLTKQNTLILGLDFQSKEIKIVDKKKVLADMNLNEVQLVHLAIMVGCSFQPVTFSHLPQVSTSVSHQPSTTIRAALDSVHQFMAFNGPSTSGFLNYVYGLHVQKLLSMFLRGVATCEYMPIITENGLVVLYNQATKEPLKSSTQNPQSAKTIVPNDVHNIISQRLPLELYFYHSIGVLPHSILEAVTSGKLSIRPPIEGANANSYKNLINSPKARKILDSQFNLITNLLARYYQVKKIEVSYWFNEKPYELNARMNPTASSCLEKFGVVESSEKNFTFRDFWACLPKKVTTKQLDIQNVSTGTLIMTSFARSLFLEGIVEENPEKSRIPQIFTKYVAQNPSVSNDNLERLFLLLYLFKESGVSLFTEKIKLQSLPGKALDAQNEAPLSSADETSVDVFAHVCSLLELPAVPLNYSGPLSRDLLSFRSCAGALKDRIFDSMQLALVDLVSAQEKLKLGLTEKESWFDILSNVPFFGQLNNNLMGIVCKTYFTAYLKSTKDGLSSKEAHLKAKTHLNNTFNASTKEQAPYAQKGADFDIESMVNEIKNAISFFKQFLTLLKAAHDFDEKYVASDELEPFVKADALLAESMA